MLASFALCATPFCGAHASVVLGEVLGQSAIGEPLRVEIRLLGGKAADVGDCLRIAPQAASADGIAPISGARLSSTGQGADARVLVTQAQPVPDPIVRLIVDNICAGGLRKEYTLLLSFPQPSELPLAAPAPLASAQQPQRPRPAPSAAAAPSPARATASSAAVDANTSRNARPSAGAPRQAPNARPSEPAPRTPQASPARATHDRLVLMGEDEAPGGLKFSFELSDPGRVSLTSESERDLLRREQRLTSALDRSIIAQMELNHRLSRLEEIQAALAAQAQLLEPAGVEPTIASTTQMQTQTPPHRSTLSGWLAPAALFAGLSLLGAALLWLYQRGLARRDAAHGLPLAADPDHPTLQAEAFLPFAATPPTAEPSPPPSAAPIPTLLGIDTDEALAATPPPPDPALHDEFAAQAALAEPPAEAHFDEHDSAVELADIMLSLGRVRGAAETLAELVLRAPRHSLTPWLKLLKAYRMAGMREEFESLAGQLNKTFNVLAVTWEQFDDMHAASDTLEQLPHIVRTLQKLWGTRECQAYLDELLRDNRDGTRQGFPLGVTDDILMLAGILEDRLGRYTSVESSGTGAAATDASAPTDDATAAPQADTPWPFTRTSGTTEQA